MKYNRSDILVDNDGDLVFGPDGDLYVTGGIGELAQGIEFRLKTELYDFLLHPMLGNQLKEMVGKRNTKEVAEEGKRTIVKCLTYGGFIDPADLVVSAIPVNSTTILYHISVLNESRIIYRLDLVCDLENGIRRV